MNTKEALRQLYPEPGDEPASLVERLEAHAVILKDGEGSHSDTRSAIADLCRAFTMPKGFAARTMTDLCINEEDEELVISALFCTLRHAELLVGKAAAPSARAKLHAYAKTLRDLRAQRKERA